MVDLKLGELITTPQQRDAIHIAVAPMVTAHTLQPGQHVGIDADGRVSEDGPHVGVIDPFLRSTVRAGSKVWLFLFPNTITSLRHDWTHPAFSAAEANKAASESWLRDFCNRSDCPGYEMVIAAAMNHPNSSAWDDDYLHFNDYDAHGEIPDEFWTHLEVVTGVKVERKAKYFSCSC